MVRFHDIPDEKKWERPNPNCTCGRPLGIVIPFGQHIHPCSVHPDVVMYGSGTIC